MNTSEFLTLLKNNSSKALIFEYGTGKTIGTNYHITEVKNVSIESVDCGGRTDAWNETVVQLWESPAEIGKKEYMSTNKAKAIMDRVHSMRPMDLSTAIRFEYGNASFHTAQLYIQGVRTGARSMTIVLNSSPTLCKASELCGVEAVTDAAEAVNCAPGTGCC